MKIPVIDITPLDGVKNTLVELTALHKWIYLSCTLVSHKEFFYSKLFFHPKSVQDQNPCLSIYFSSDLYFMLYDGDPYEKRELNQEVKRELTTLGFGLANATHADGFIIDFDESDTLTSLDSEQIKNTMLTTKYLDGDGTEYRHLMALHNSIISLSELEGVWGKHESLYETTTGYIILDSF